MTLDITRCDGRYRPELAAECVDCARRLYAVADAAMDPPPRFVSRIEPQPFPCPVRRGARD